MNVLSTLYNKLQDNFLIDLWKQNVVELKKFGSSYLSLSFTRTNIVKVASGCLVCFVAVYCG